VKKHLDKLWGKAVTFVGMTVSAVLFCLTFFSAWLYWNVGAILCNLLFLVVLLPCLSFQLRSAGHWEGHEGIYLTWLDRIPLDIYLCAGLVAFMLGMESYDSEIAFVCGLITTVMAALLVPSVAARVKSGTLWRNTMLWRIYALLRRYLGTFFAAIVRTLRSIPLLWSTLAVLLALSAVDLLFLAWDSRMTTISIWTMVRLVEVLLILYMMLDIRTLLQGGEQMAKGDFSRKIQVSSLLPAVRQHADHLNSIQDGLQTAVEERTKSERLKTELITNVSHDIKTPLTSIVNYVDLLKKTEVTDPTAREYIDVLERQAARLRKLTEDLVEASKAATGNMAVHFTSTNLNVLLAQACGEYEQRLAEKQLQPVLTLLEEPPHILADGQLLWRVMDNLMSNVCKYAMPGTRVYLITEVLQDSAVVTVKNISQYPLDVSGQELTERFVRGDSSRSTEGSGLGLSIAASLTALQKGEFSIVVDGDLFKAQMTFPLEQKEI